MNTIVILHGWGSSSKQWDEVKNILEKEDFKVEIPDLPGFGGQPLVKSPMSFDDYVEFAKKLIGKRKIILIGHSFGGRLAIKFASQNPELVSKLILTGASGVNRDLSLKRKIAYILAKIGKLFFPSFFRKLIYYWIGEWDYFKSGKLIETFKRVYKIDIKEFLPNIKVQTLLVWGERDNVIPISDGRYIKGKIRSSRLIVVKGATHNLPYNMPNVFIEKILPFLRND